MNQFTRFRYVALAATALAAASCSKFLDVNASPNNPTTVQPAVQLPTITVGTAFLVGNTLGRDGDLFIQHYAGIANQPFTEDKYAISGNYDNEWRGDLYGNNLNGAQTLINNNAANPAYTGIAKLLKAYNFALATDMWGDVPYSQALQGLANIHPAFDRQQDIYQGANGIQSLFDLVREGLADLNKTGGLTPAGDDFVYKGDLAKWRKVGNMLLLKFACTVSRKNPDLAISVINEVLNKTGSDPAVLGSAAIASNAEDFAVPFGAAVGNTNPYYAYNVTNRPNDQMASTRFLDSLVAYNDPRLPKYYTTIPANAPATHVSVAYGRYAGFENGSTAAAPSRTTTANNRSVYNTYVVGASGEAPMRLLTNFQRAFILAECAVQLGTRGDANALYQEGIRASMLETGLSAADITTYFANNPTIVTLSGTKVHRLNQILFQKWIAWVGNGYEAWNDYRRTGSPHLQPALNVVFTPTIPQRLLYPPSELAANGDVVPKTNVTIEVPVWWASK
jgi:hypothetical protein